MCRKNLQKSLEDWLGFGQGWGLGEHPFYIKLLLRHHLQKLLTGNIISNNSWLASDTSPDQGEIKVDNTQGVCEQIDRPRGKEYPSNKGICMYLLYLK